MSVARSSTLQALLKQSALGLLVALSAIFLASALPAQIVETGIITGVVKDNSGAVIPNAQVVVRNTETGLTTSSTSNGQGIYVSPPLKPGNYTVEISVPGFSKSVEKVRLEVGQRVAADVALTLGSTNETIEVQATGGILETESSSVSNLRTEKAVHDLPLNGRNFAELLGLGAGVVPGQSQLAGSPPYVQQRGPTSYAIDGQRMTDNRLLLDGIADSENHNGLGVIIFPPIDAVEEFREETNGADARYGRYSGGVINLVYKSGTNHYHGEVFDFFRNSVLDARNYFDPPKIPGFRMNSFGATFGGPLFRQKDPRTFFFADYSGERLSQGLTSVDTVVDWGPQGVGDFSNYSQIVHDPISKLPFPGNVVPASYLSSPQSQVGQNVLALILKYAAPNVPGATTANNFLFNPQRIDNSNDFDVKVDHQFNQADSAFIRYSQARDSIIQPGVLPAPLVGATTSGPAQSPAYQTVLSETHVFSPTLINTVRFGWSRIFVNAQNFDAGLNLSTQLGIPGVIVPTDTRHSDGLPSLSFTGATTIGDAANSPTQIGTNNYQEDDNVSLVRGKHSFDVGGEVFRLQYNVYQTGAEHGTMSFTGNYTGLGLADLLLGAPTSGIYQYQPGTRGFRQLGLALYAQDNYKLNNRLTLNLGLRYDDFLGWPWKETQNRIYEFEPNLSTTQVFQVGTNGISASGVKGNKTNFEPRVGFAYQLGAKTLLDGGYGIYYAAPNLALGSTGAINAPEVDYWSFNNTGYGTPGFNYVSNGFVHTRATTNAPQGSPLVTTDPNIRTPYSEQWHLSVQQQIGAATRITVAYVGNVGVHLTTMHNINQATPGISTSPIATRRPYPYFAQIGQLQGNMISNYHGLQLSAERRTRDLTYLFSYTYSHALDENSNNAGAPVNSYNQHADYGNGDNNIPNRFVGSVNYSLPFEGSGWLRPVVRGWELNAILTYSDGIPFSVFAGSNSLNIADGIKPMAQLVGPGNGSLPSGKRTVNAWFNTAAFTNPGPQQFGNSGRNILQGPGTKNVDFSVFKNFSLHEGRTLQLRSEFFNIFNTTQFNNPNSTIGPGFGKISSAGSPNTLQRVSREIQLAAKFSF
jgi:Carboxypeptidase regulatory-like domain/TonB dependent receptor